MAYNQMSLCEKNRIHHCYNNKPTKNTPHKAMKIITTREIRNETKAFFELAEKERVAIKRGNKYVNLIVTDEPDTKFVSKEWIDEFMSIPMEYRCNPFDISPSGDLFFADKRNVEHLDNAVIRARSGQTGKLSKADQMKILGL
jgi:hypothetical protein